MDVSYVDIIDEMRAGAHWNTEPEQEAEFEYLIVRDALEHEAEYIVNTQEQRHNHEVVFVETSAILVSELKAVMYVVENGGGK